jgi:hypothetical protein
MPQSRAPAIKHQKCSWPSQLPSKQMIVTAHIPDGLAKGRAVQEYGMHTWIWKMSGWEKKRNNSGREEVLAPFNVAVDFFALFKMFLKFWVNLKFFGRGDCFLEFWNIGIVFRGLNYVEITLNFAVCGEYPRLCKYFGYR